MSFILDALKKLEKEKAARVGGNVNISDGILRNDYCNGGRRGRRPAPFIAVAGGIFFLALILVAAGIFLWRGRNGESERMSTAGDANVQEGAAAFPEPPPPAASPAQVVRESPPAPPAPSATPVSPAPSPAAPVESAPPLPPPVAAGENAGETHQAGAPVGNSPVVSGIAWQQDRSSRRAVVNGVLVSEGKMAGGAKVVEIKQSSVRFSSNGRAFEVTISSPVVGR